jgi:hypothetical protein
MHPERENPIDQEKEMTESEDASLKYKPEFEEMEKKGEGEEKDDITTQHSPPPPLPPLGPRSSPHL